MKYYYISVSWVPGYYHGPSLAKSETGDLFGDHYLYDSLLKTWVQDRLHIVDDHIIGYDPGEEPPYRTGNTDIMEEMKEITRDEAIKIINEKNYKFSILRTGPYEEILKNILEEFK